MSYHPILNLEIDDEVYDFIVFEDKLYISTDNYFIITDLELNVLSKILNSENKETSFFIYKKLFLVKEGDIYAINDLNENLSPDNYVCSAYTKGENKAIVYFNDIKIKYKDKKIKIDYRTIISGPTIIIYDNRLFLSDLYTLHIWNLDDLDHKTIETEETIIEFYIICEKLFGVTKDHNIVVIDISEKKVTYIADIINNEIFTDAIIYPYDNYMILTQLNKLAVVDPHTYDIVKLDKETFVDNHILKMFIHEDNLYLFNSIDGDNNILKYDITEFLPDLIK